MTISNNASMAYAAMTDRKKSSEEFQFPRIKDVKSLVSKKLESCFKEVAHILGARKPSKGGEAKPSINMLIRVGVLEGVTSEVDRVVTQLKGIGEGVKLGKGVVFFPKTTNLHEKAGVLGAAAHLGAFAGVAASHLAKLKPSLAISLHQAVEQGDFKSAKDLVHHDLACAKRIANTMNKGRGVIDEGTWNHYFEGHFGSLLKVKNKEGLTPLGAAEKTLKGLQSSETSKEKLNTAQSMVDLLKSAEKSLK